MATRYIRKGECCFRCPTYGQNNSPYTRHLDTYRYGGKKKSQNQTAKWKRKYRKNDSSANRLCADDVMTRVNLKFYQDSYAQCMQRYGLKRGIDGSEAKHMTNSQYYRDLLNQSESIQEDIKNLSTARKSGKRKEK